MGNYNRPGLGGRNPYPLGAQTNTFAFNGPPRSNLGIGPNVMGTTALLGNPLLYSPAAMSMNGVYATQYGPYGLATNGSQLNRSNGTPTSVQFVPGVGYVIR